MKKLFTQKNGMIALGIALFAGISANAQITFSNQGAMLQSIGGTSYADCAADMNGDSYDDVVRVVETGIYIDFQQMDGTFDPAFFPLVMQNLPSWSICAGDIDNNGFTDLLIGDGNAVSFVYANDDGTAYTEDAHPEYIFTQRSTFADIDNDGNLDAFANHDVDQCHPYRNVDGNLVLDFTLIQTLDVGGNYAAIWVDYDNDWDTDLYITKCRGGAGWGDLQRINLLYKNNGDGTYTEAAAEANMNDGNQSWTTVFEDFDNDGDFDAFTVNHASSDVPGGAANKFNRNNGDGTFTDIIGTTGINAADLGAWNCDAGDFDNNGFVDIFSEMGTQMYWNNGDGTFTGQSIAFNSGGIGDLNDDGFLDVISGNSMWMNSGNTNNFVKFDLEGIESNKDGIGARIEIYGSWGIQIREVRAGESFDPASSLISHFGLGAADAIDQVVVKWPSGTITTIANPEINQLHLIVEAGCIGEAVTITATGNTTICPGESVTLNAPAGVSYTWSNGSTGQTLEASSSGNYSVIVWNESACASISNNIVVSVIEEDEPVVTINGDDTFCSGSNAVLTSTVAQTYTWSNGQSGQSIVVSQSGDYHVNITGACSGVAYESNSVSITVLPAPAPIIQNATIGDPGTAVLNAIGDNIKWYATETSDVVLGTGNSFTTDFFSNSISYWAEATKIYGGEEMTGGKSDNAGGGGLPSSGGRLFFNITEDVILQQLTVYVPAESTAGNRTIELYDDSGVLLESAVVNCAAGENVIDLNFDLPVGTGYQIGCVENNLYRNNAGLVYPYAIGDVGSIYDSSFGTGYYYYFYNWKVKKEETTCVSARVEATASVVGLNELTNPLGIKLYPNPASDILTITSLHTNQMVQINVTDAMGRTVLTQQVNMAGNNNNTIQISELASGMYHMTVTSDNQHSALEFVKE